MKTEGHIFSEFDDALSELKSDTSLIAQRAIVNIEHAMRGLIEQNVEFCDRAIKGDEEVNELEMKIDRQCVSIMSKHRPFAGDLRLVIASMKITHNLERISDHAEDIAKRAKKLIKWGGSDEILSLEPLQHSVLELLRDAHVAYVDGNLDVARFVVLRVAKFRKLQKSLTKNFIVKIDIGSENYKIYLNLIFIDRWLERIAAHAVNIAEDVIFMETSQDIRHGGEFKEDASHSD